MTIVSLLKNKINLYRLDKILEVDKRGLITTCILLVFSGVMVFASEILFALSLQRFLVSVGLIQDLANTRILGDVRNGYVEAITLLLVLLLRLFAIGINTGISGYGYSRFENKVKSRIAVSTFNSPTNDVSKVSYLINEIAIGSSNFVATLFIYISRFTILFFLLGSLIFYSWFITFGIAILCILIFPLQKVFSQGIKNLSRSIVKYSEETSSGILAGSRNFIFLKIRGVDKIEFLKVSNGLNKILMLRKSFYILTSLRTSIPQLAGVTALVVIAASPLTLKLDNRSEIVPFLYLMLRFFISFGDLLRSHSHIRLDYPRVVELTDWIMRNPIQGNAKSTLLSYSSRELPSFYLNDVEFEWRPGSKKLHYNDIHIPSGKITLVKGKNGSGKSTLIMLICGIIKPSRGEVVLASVDEDTSNLQIESSKNSTEALNYPIAYVGSSPYLISGSISENLTYGLDSECNKLDIEKAAREVGLLNSDQDRTILERQISESGIGISAGQIQKIAWARAILTKPKLLILDEATTNLDSHSREVMFNWLKSTKNRLTTIIIDHTLEKSSWIDNTISLDMNT